MTTDAFALTREQKHSLLNIARQSIYADIQGHVLNLNAFANIDQSIHPCGAFVSLHHHHPRSLRGCMGSFEPKGTISQTIHHLALTAAMKDPRFPPLTDKEELEKLQIEISLLSPSQPITIEEIIVGTHGLSIEKGYARGVFLPQVPIEWNWDKKTYLEQLCKKAGLPTDAYLHPKTRIESFTAEVFSEDD